MRPAKLHLGQVGREGTSGEGQFQSVQGINSCKGGRECRGLALHESKGRSGATEWNVSLEGPWQSVQTGGAESRRNGKVRQQPRADCILALAPNVPTIAPPGWNEPPAPPPPSQLRATVVLCPLAPEERETTRMAPGSSSGESLTLENHPHRGEEEGPPVSCISHQVSLMCLS